jgi:inward rectifier potassium channel
MQKPSFDPGLTQQVTGVLRRSINKDGSFNVSRRGGSWRDVHPYLHLLNISWPRFFGLVLFAFFAINLLFAVVYFALGASALAGANTATEASRFLDSFFFSSHTLTTVGYGNLAPATIGANVVSSLEALIGLMGAAIGTGLLFGRFSRPSAKIAFSERILVAPYQEGSSVQFRVANSRSNVLMDLSATVLLMTVESSNGDKKRTFRNLPLEREGINFLALTWTVVHPIDEASPLHGKTAQDLASLQAEFVIVIRGFDDTFSQTVNARYSYRYDEIAWQAKFEPAFEFDAGGNMVLNVDRVGDYAVLGP